MIFGLSTLLATGTAPVVTAFYQSTAAQHGTVLVVCWLFAPDLQVAAIPPTDDAPR